MVSDEHHATSNSGPSSPNFIVLLSPSLYEEHVIPKTSVADNEFRAKCNQESCRCLRERLEREITENERMRTALAQFKRLVQLKDEKIRELEMLRKRGMNPGPY